MTERPAKRPRRTDSSAMWDMNDKRPRSSEPEPEGLRSPRRESYAKDAGRRNDRRYRSRSRDRRDRRRERSRSRDRGDRDRDRRDREGRGMRNRERSSSRDRYYDRRGYPSTGDRQRDRSRSPIGNGTRDRSRSPPPRGVRGDRRGDRRDYRAPNGASDRPTPRRGKDDMEMDIDEGGDDLESTMRRSMGFSRFRTTKNTKVPGNEIYGVRKEKKIEYRQYMNRPGGFNRPLSPSR